MRIESPLGPKEVNTVEFDCLIRPPVEPYTALVLRDAVWSHRGRWHLTGLLHGSAEDKMRMVGCDTAEIIYADKSSETVAWYTVPGNLAYQLAEIHGRFGAYVQDRPRYPRGCNTERLAGVEVSVELIPRIHSMLDRHLPGLDNQRRSWLIQTVEQLRNEEVANATRRLARQHADSLDARSDLRRLVTSAIDDWAPGDDDEQTRTIMDRIERLIDLDEKGLPLF